MLQNQSCVYLHTLTETLYEDRHTQEGVYLQCKNMHSSQHKNSKNNQTVVRLRTYTRMQTTSLLSHLLPDSAAVMNWKHVSVKQKELLYCALQNSNRKKKGYFIGLRFHWQLFNMLKGLLQEMAWARLKGVLLGSYSKIQLFTICTGNKVN